MEILTSPDNLKGGPVAVTIGSFDGVHRGHRAMIAEARALADERGLPLTVVTFARHPRLLFSGSTAPFLLTDTDEKLSLLADEGVERCLLLPFDQQMASLSARDFMKLVLKEKMNVAMLAVGYDHRFGSPASGEGFGQYMQYGKELSMEVVQMHRYAPDGDAVSSSKIRGALTAGDMQRVEQLLGRTYSFTGSVVQGAALGRRLGFPTANISLAEPLKMLPLDGVYECRIDVRAQLYKGVMNIGCKPTLDNKERTIEVFIIDFEGNIYGEKVRVEVLRRLRGERRFAGLDELRAQIELDVRAVTGNKE